MKTTEEQVAEFHRAFDLPYNRAPGMCALHHEERKEIDDVAKALARLAEFCHQRAAHYHSMPLLRLQLMVEELGEVADAIASGTVSELLKELNDMQYVVDGTYISYGLDKVKAESFAEVHASNMSKLGEDGKPVKSEGGRVMKGPNYRLANMKQFF